MIAQTFLSAGHKVDRRGFFYESKIHLFDRDEPSPVVDGKLVDPAKTALCNRTGEIASVWDAATTQRILARVDSSLCSRCVSLA